MTVAAEHSSPAAPCSSERARAATGFVRARRIRRLRPSLYQVYVTLLLGAMGVALAGGAISSLAGPGLGARALIVWGPGVLALALLAALRFGCSQGPVLFSAADVALLLAAPIALADLVRPKLDQACVAGAIAGLALGGLALLICTGGPAGLGAPRSVCAVLAFASLGVLAIASSWIVQRSRKAALGVLRASPLIVIGAAGLVLAAGAGGLGRTLATWSGPWGWAIAPLSGSAGWPIATGLMLLVAVYAVIRARRMAGAAMREQFLVRAETRAGMTASVVLLDYRAATLTHRAALGAGPGRGGRVPRPASPRLVVLWRDALALSRDPFRVLWAGVLGAAGTWEVIAHPGRPQAAGLGAGGLYFAASLLCEPLRADVDYPDKSRLLLSWDFGRVLVAHCALPAIVLFAVASGAIVAAVGTGTADTGALALIPTVLAPFAGGATLCAALTARRGGRIDASVLLSSSGGDPSGGGIALVAWLASWLLVDLIAFGGPMLLLGAAAAHHRGVIAGAALALAVGGAATAALLAYARRSPTAD